jgi:integrase
LIEPLHIEDVLVEAPKVVGMYQDCVRGKVLVTLALNQAGPHQNWLVPAAKKAGIGQIGWHTFRHSHSTLLHALGVDLKVQQELLRHADVRTTMNIYTQAVPKALREANSKVVRLVLPA